MLERLWARRHPKNTYYGTVLTLKNFGQIYSPQKLTLKVLPISPTPDLALLNLTSDRIPPAMRKITINILLAARLSLTRFWKSNPHPKLLDLITPTQTHHIFELLITTNKSAYLQEKQKWEPWLTWYNNFMKGWPLSSQINFSPNNCTHFWKRCNCYFYIFCKRDPTSATWRL